MTTCYELQISRPIKLIHSLEACKPVCQWRHKKRLEVRACKTSIAHFADFVPPRRKKIGGDKAKAIVQYHIFLYLCAAERNKSGVRVSHIAWIAPHLDSRHIQTKTLGSASCWPCRRGGGGWRQPPYYPSNA